MKISIIIPVYNVAPYVADCIRSVMRQTWQGELECVFIDDCGTDNSMAVVQQTIQDYQGPIVFKTVSHEQNRGLSAARNTGMSVATGDYVYFLDSDDEITSDCIERMTAPLATEAYDMTIAQCRIEGGKLPGVDLKLTDGTVLRHAEILDAYRHENWYMMSVNKLYRMDFLKTNHLQFREGIIFEDELWSFQMACTARSMAVVGHETYIYKLREGSITVNAQQTLLETKEARKRQCLLVVLGEMFQFAKSRQMLTNQDVHNLIENFRIGCLSKIQRHTPELLKSFYREQRQAVPYSWWHCCRLDQSDLKKQVRDFHLALPVGLAIPYLRLLLWYYLKKAGL